MDPLLEDYGLLNRIRTSNLYTLFSDNQSVLNSVGILWDEANIVGTSSSSFDTFKRVLTMTVPAGTQGDRKRQTYQRFNCSPGKSILSFQSFACKSSSYLNDFYGIMVGDGNTSFAFTFAFGVASFRVRSDYTGSVTEIYFPQSEWNINRMDGKGNVDNPQQGTKAKLNFFGDTHVLVIERVAFPQGYVRFGFMINGVICWAHQYSSLNGEGSINFSRMNLPLLYAVSGNGSNLDSINLEVGASAVFVEGGEEYIGVLRTLSGQTFTYPTNNIIYPSIGIRLASQNAAIVIENVAIELSSANDRVKWGFYRNPTLLGTPLGWSTTGYIQGAQGSAATTIQPSTGIVTQQGYLTSTQPIYIDSKNIVRLGFSLSGVPDELILGLQALTSGIDLQSTITYRELL